MRTLSLIALLSLIAALLSFSAFGAAQPAVKPNQLPAITNGQLSATDLFLLFDSSAGTTKKLAVSEMDTRYGGGSVGTGDVVGPSSSVASEFALFDGTTGKLIKRASGTGVCKATSGVASFAALLNADVDAAAGIAFSKMAALTASRVAVTDASGFVVAGTQTTTELALLTSATNANTASTLVKRDGSGNFSAGTITGALAGNASTATAFASNPTDCGAGEFANAIAANGNLTCATPSASATAAAVYTTATGSYASGGDTVFTASTARVNVGNAYNTSTGVFTAQETRVHYISANFQSGTNAGGGGALLSITLFINGTTKILLGEAKFEAGYAGPSIAVHRPWPLTAGDTAVLLIYQSGFGGSISGENFQSVSYLSFL
jgi:hypothetical protein